LSVYPQVSVYILFCLSFFVLSHHGFRRHMSHCCHNFFLMCLTLIWIA
jgi:hypothetical protein